MPFGTITARQTELARTPERAVRPGSRAGAAPSAPLRRRTRSTPSAARPFAAEAIASATARSAPGSSMRTPPATLTNTSACPSATPGVPGEHGDDHREPLRVDAGGDAARHREVGLARRVPGSRAGSVACPRARTRRRRRPRRLRCGRRRSDGSGTPDEPCARHLEHAELVRRAEAVLRPRAGRGARGTGRPRTGARSRRGARARAGRRRSRPSSRGRRGCVATPGSFATRRSRAAASRTCATEPGRRAELRRVERLHRVDHAHVGPLALERRADRVSSSVSARISTCSAPAEPRGPQLDLRRRTPRR